MVKSNFHHSYESQSVDVKEPVWVFRRAAREVPKQNRHVKVDIIDNHT